MASVFVARDYGLLGPEADKAAAAGLVSAKWYAPNISRAELKELMRRVDGPVIRDTLIWFGALIVSGGLGCFFWGVLPPRRSFSSMACSMAQPPTAAGMNAATAPRSRRNG